MRLPSRFRLATIAACTSMTACGLLLGAWSSLVEPPAPTAVVAVTTPAERDLRAIRADGVLRVAATRDDVAWIERKGLPEGFAADLASWLGERLDLRVELVIPRNPAHGLVLVRDGDADLLALADPGPRFPGEGIAWTTAIEHARPVVVGRGADAVKTIDDLRGRTVTVRRHSHLDLVAREWRTRLGGALRVVQVAPNVTDRGLASAAAKRDHDLVLLDEHRARLEAEAFGPLSTSAPLGDPLPVRWAARRNAPELLANVSALFERARQDGLVAEIGRRYLDDPFRLKALRRPIFRPHGPHLSPWDGLFREAASEHGFDWRMIAALSFAESGYDRWEVSPVGAMGLLQLMPGIASAYGAEDPYDPQQNVDAGARLLRWLHDVYDEIPEGERTAFALAAYNMGIGHLEDARRLAEDRGLDANRWSGHVEKILPLLEDPKIAADLPHGRARGSVTVRYVRHVLALWRGFGGPALASAPAAEPDRLEDGPAA